MQRVQISSSNQSHGTNQLYPELCPAGAFFHLAQEVPSHGQNPALIFSMNMGPGPGEWNQEVIL